MERLQKSIMELGERISDYDELNGTITQLKNAWETIRCICISQGIVSINKNEIFIFCQKHFSDRVDLEMINDIYNFYLNKQDTKLFEGNFRKKLYDFSLKLIQIDIFK
jgi:hypothetical protein